MRYARRGFYRSQRGLFFGVCQGIAEWRSLPAWPIRLVFLLFFIFTGGFIAVMSYCALALFMPPEPVQGEESSPYSPEDDPPGPQNREEPEWKKRFFKR
ncbi:MAG: PspC domain-containing protein [Spirochaetales bacterium]|nr:PspC domain-containing protein [Spirochaetales bacterium]